MLRIKVPIQCSKRPHLEGIDRLPSLPFLVELRGVDSGLASRWLWKQAPAPGGHKLLAVAVTGASQR
jgi:hypothetical protein